MNKLISFGQDYFSSLHPGEIKAFQKYEQENISDCNKNSLSLKTCIISKCFINKVILSSSDFDSCKFEKCMFDSSPLNNTDICSTVFVDCCFNNISFQNATISDSTFINCTFDKCNLDHVTLTDTQFESCTFSNVRLRQSSSYLNEFLNVTFQNVQINGNLFYNIFSNCNFNNSKFEKTLIGYNFGFDSNAYNVFDLTSKDFEIYRNELIDKYEFFNAAIIEFNFLNEYRELALLNCIEAIGKMINNDIVVRVEQISFLKNIYLYLVNSNKLTPITNIELIKRIETILIHKKHKTKINLKALEQLEVFKNYCYYEYKVLLSKIDEQQKKFSIKSEDIIIKITFEKEPLYPIVGLINIVKNELGIQCEDAKRLKTEQGSFIEFISAPDNILPCLSLVVSVLGIITEIVLQKKDAKPQKTISEKEQPQIVTNNYYTTNVNVFGTTAEGENKVAIVLPIIQGNGININNNYSGYTNDNVKEITYFYK